VNPWPIELPTVLDRLTTDRHPRPVGLRTQTQSTPTRTETCIRVATQLHRGPPKDPLSAETGACVSRAGASGAGSSSAHGVHVPATRAFPASAPSDRFTVGSFVGPNVAEPSPIRLVSVSASRVRFARFTGDKPPVATARRCFTRERSQVRNPPRPSSEAPASAGVSSFWGDGAAGANGATMPAPVGAAAPHGDEQSARPLPLHGCISASL